MNIMEQMCWVNPGIDKSRDKEKELDPIFEAQFKKTHFLNVSNYRDSDEMIPSECVEIFRVTPENVRKPTILIPPGFDASALTYKNEIQELWKKGRDVLSVKYPDIAGPEDISDTVAPLITRSQVSNDEILNAATLLRVLDNEHVDEVNVIAHSAGAIAATLVAVMDPKHRVRSIVFFCPAGILSREGRRTISGLNEERIAGLDWRKLTLRKLFTAFTEGMGVLNADVRPLIKILHEKGIKLFIVGATKDGFFPAEILGEFVKKYIGEKYVDGLITIEGGHHDITDYMSAAEDIFTKNESENAI